MPRIQISVPDRQPQPYRFPIDREKVTFGRGSENDIPLKSGSVSIHHAEMVRVTGGFELRDLGSTNGITYEGERKISMPLKSGMKLKMGEVGFQFELNDEEAEELRRESTPAKTEPRPQSTTSDGDEAEEEGLEERPRKKKPRRESPRPNPPAAKPSGVGVLFVFFIFAAIAMFVGMALRHEKDTGKPLLDTILGK